MKKLILTILILTSIILTGCDPADQYPISYKYNGTTWYAASAVCILTGSNNIAINALSTVQNQNRTNFYFEQYSVGTHPIDGINNYFSYDSDADTTNGGYYAQNHNPASLTITEFNTSTKKIVGTFHGVLYNQAETDSIVITDGKFDLNYQQ